jgi:hypothetical protein
MEGQQDFDSSFFGARPPRRDSPIGKAQAAEPVLPGKEQGRLGVNVLFTTHAGTLAALRSVSRLGASLNVLPNVLMPYVVPYSLPFDWRAVPEGFLEEKIRALSRESPTALRVRIYLCRNTRETLRRILQPRSLVVVGGRRRWWPSHEQRLVRALKKSGIDVIFVNQDLP